MMREEWRIKNRNKIKEYQQAWYIKNKEKVRARQAIYRAENLEEIKAAIRMNNARRRCIEIYNVDPSEKEVIYEAQNHCCAACGRKKKIDELVFDHIHDKMLASHGLRLKRQNKKVRGLICDKCNTIIGFADDFSDILESIAAYVRRRNAELTELDDLEKTKE